MATIIGFSGAIESGKDECVKFFQRQYPNVIHLKVAHALQDTVAGFAGIYTEDLSHRKLFDNRIWKEEYPLVKIGGTTFTPRQLQKIFGDKFRDVIHPKVWESFLDEAIEGLPMSTVVCISDIRYDDDLRWVERNGGYNVYVQRQVAEDAYYASLEGGLAHRSESFLDFCRENAWAVVDNNRSLSYLYEQLEVIYQDTVCVGF